MSNIDESDEELRKKLRKQLAENKKKVEELSKKVDAHVEELGFNGVGMSRDFEERKRKLIQETEDLKKRAKKLSEQEVKQTSSLKVQYGLGSEGMRKLRLLAYRIIDEGGVKVPKGRMDKLITSLDIKHKLTEREKAYPEAIDDLIEWFKNNTKPFS